MSNKAKQTTGLFFKSVHKLSIQYRNETEQTNRSLSEGGMAIKFTLSKVNF